MKVLLLTPIDQINSAYYYGQMIDFFEKKEKLKVQIISVPFFAETNARMEEKLYLPTLFGMWNVLKEDKKVKKKVYKGQNVLVIGNSYKCDDFDMIVSLGDEEENDYILYIRDSYDFKDTKLQEKAKELYSWKDAEINLPTVEHLKKFLEGAFK
jgi:hypothetical protein